MTSTRIRFAVSGLAIIGLLSVSRARAQDKVAAVGDKAPAFSLPDHTGKTVSLADFKDKIVILEWWNEGCPYCLRHARNGTMKAIAAKYQPKDVVWLAINSTNGSSNQSNAQCVERFELNYPILNDSAGSVGRRYGAKTTPHLFIIDRQGVLAYSGAIDDDSEGRKDNDTNYVTNALDELLAGKSVTVNQTKPYGCSVKYAR